MGTTIERVYFYAYSNVGSVLRKETQSWHSNTAAKVANANADKLNISTGSKLNKSKEGSISINRILNKLLGEQLTLKLKNAIYNMMLSKSSRTAGLNIGALSIRINELLIPALSLAYVAMLPVIAGLLTIASAAATAMAGIAGVMGFGLYSWYKKFKGTGSGGYGGARRPYSSGSSNDKSFTDEVFAGFADVLEDNEIRRKIEKATAWTKEIFRVTLPEAFGAFMREVDMGLLKKYVDMFKNWVVGAGQGLAQFGNQLMSIMGGEGLSAINKALSTIASGIIKTAKWLSSGGFETLNKFFGVLVSVLDDLFDIGAATLPILTAIIKGLWDAIKPVADTFAKFFDMVSGNEKAIKMFEKLGYIAGIVLMTIFGGRYLKLVIRFVRWARNAYRSLAVIHPLLQKIGTVFNWLAKVIGGVLGALGISWGTDKLSESNTKTPHDLMLERTRDNSNNTGNNSTDVNIKVGVDKDSGNLQAWLDNTTTNDTNKSTGSGRHGRMTGGGM